MAHIGIDLGTTNSVVAYVEDGEAEVIENSATGLDTTPSAVLINHAEDADEDDDVAVGRSALSKRVTEPDKVITRAKDDMGQTDEDGDPVTLEADGAEYRPEEVSSYILEYLVEDAKEKVGEVDGAVVTVPYYFDEQSREATRAAAKMADLDLDQLMNEPTAAIMAYALEDVDFSGTALVYDLGGGTFDATLVDVGDNVNEVIGTNGKRDLGGENFDDELYDYVCDEIDERGLPDPSEHPSIEENLREAVVTAKEDFSNMGTTQINVMLGTENFDMELSEEDFNDVVSPLVDDTLDALDELFDDENVDASQDDVDEVIMVGGSSRIPLVEEEVESYFGMEANKLVNPDKAVAIGAAVEAMNFDEEIDEEERKALPGGTPTTTIDVLSHSLGVEALPEDPDTDDPDPIFDPILERNQSVPHEETEPYVNAYDDQTTISTDILQGEGEYPDDPDVESLAELKLTDLEPRPARETKIEVTFDVDEEGILHAEAEDVATGESVTVELDDELSLDEIEEMESDRGDIQRRGAGDD